MVRLVPSRKLDVLDLGCGTGLVGARFHPLARTLTGIDLSPNMLEVARQRRLYVDLICSELTEFLQMQTKNFDLAVATDVFLYIGDLSGVAQPCGFRRWRPADCICQSADPCADQASATSTTA
jgi:predicted TPR repeat methyltransferase